MNRPDQYQERARAPAIAAGLDPDARIERRGQRSMPTWCTFRDAARDEHLAREQAAAAAEIATIAPQAAAFQNAPLKVFGRHDEATVAQMRNCMAVGNVVAGVICADGHLGYAQPVGGVIAYEKQISISGVGFDIGCGNMAVRLDTPFRAIEDRIGTIIKDVARVISFGVGRTNEERVDHDLFDDGEAWRQSDMEAYRQKAVTQLGTVGSGNHYVDLMRDEDGFVWIGVHFGSRGLGHTSATRYLKAAGGKDGMNVPPAVLYEDGELGRRYIAAMQLAGRYSYAGREWVIERVRKIIGGAVTDMVHNHHNDARRTRSVGGAQRCHASLPRPAGFRRRLDGRRCGDPQGRRRPGGPRVSLS
jgi:tRNA-splicing ligase RtcB (3'-phosphate/5'-hydroxy nucleic acid ligase)